jgi:hypothetical protein
MKNFHMVRTALEEHLSAINENTTEIQALFDYLQEMEMKMEKLSHRLDTVQLKSGEELDKPKVEPLDQLEKKVFLVLYTEQIPLCYEEICAKAAVPLGLIQDCISTLISKGIPLLRSRIQEKLYLKLSPSFKDLQAKENIINLSLQSFIE